MGGDIAWLGPIYLPFWESNMQVMRAGIKCHRLLKQE